MIRQILQNGITVLIVIIISQRIIIVHFEACTMMIVEFYKTLFQALGNLLLAIIIYTRIYFSFLMSGANYWYVLFLTDALEKYYRTIPLLHRYKISFRHLINAHKSDVYGRIVYINYTPEDSISAFLITLTYTCIHYSWGTTAVAPSDNARDPYNSSLEPNI